MRILHLSSEYPPAPVYGLGRYVHELAETQSSLKHFVVVITNSLNGNEHETIQNGVTVKRVHFPPPPLAPSHSAMLLHFNLQIVERTIEGLDLGGSGHFDVVNAHDWLTVPAAFHLSRLLKCPLVTTIHDVIFNKARGRKFTSDDAYIAGIENWACHVSNRVIVLSESVKYEILKVYHADAAKISVVLGGAGIKPLSDDEFNTVAHWRSKILPDDEDLLLYVGRFDLEKGLFVLLDAARELSKLRPSGWKLVLAGRGKLQDVIEKKIDESGLRGRITLLGYLQHTELRIAYAASDVLVVPSEYEPFGLVALEAQRMGTPVIVSDVGGLAETIQRTGGGLTFPAGNATALFERLNVLLDQPNLRKELGIKAQSNSGQKYGWTKLARELDAVYETARKQPPPKIPLIPDWGHPFLNPEKSPQQALPREQSAAENHRLERYELNDVVVFWSNRNMPELKPVLERLVEAHALIALDGKIKVVPVSESKTVANWNVPLKHPRIDYIQPENLNELWSTTATVIAPIELEAKLKEAEILDAAQVPTIWLGLGNPTYGWCLSGLNELYALANKLLCDEYIRSVLAPSLRHPIPQWQVKNLERFKPLILHVVFQIVTGGGETTLLELIKGTSEFAQYCILCLGPCIGPLPDEFRKLGVEIIFPKTTARNEVLQLIANKCPDLIHLHSLSAAIPWLPVHRHLAEWNIIESEHVVEIGSGQFGRVDRVVCVSNAVRDAHRKYESAWRDHGSDFSVIYNGIDPAEYAQLPDKSAARALLKLPKDRLIVGRVSALARNKCTEEAIGVIAEFVKLREDALFVIVGDGPQRADVERWIAEHELQDHVRLLGERRDVPLVLRALDLFAYHTPKEALGNVILEAIAAGLPVVCSDVEGTREAMDGSRGELVPNGNPPAFAQAILRWTDPGSMTQNPLPVRFTRTYMCEQFRELYRAHLGEFKPLAPQYVTVLIPFLNPRIDWLTEALESIKKQTYSHWKLLLVDDGSNDEIKKCVNDLIANDPIFSHRTTIINLLTNQGLSRALNAGLRACETEYVARLDADDRMFPKRLELQFAALNQDPELAVVGGRIRRIDDRGNSIGRNKYPTLHADIKTMMGKCCAVAHPAVMFRRSIVLKSGGYRDGATHFEDYDLRIRLMRAGAKFSNLPVELIDYRVHAASVSQVRQKDQAYGTRFCIAAARILHGQSKPLRVAVFCPCKRNEDEKFPDFETTLCFNPSDSNGFDYVIDLDKPFTAMAGQYPPKRRIYATTEPSKFTNYSAELVRRLNAHYGRLILSWHSSLRTLPQCRLWHGAETRIKNAERINPKKLFALGGIISEKHSNGMDGYAFRRDLLKQQNRITIPGTVYNHTKRWKGKNVPYPLKDKNAVMDAMFHIAIESSSEPDFFTEKLIDAFVAKCVPLYYGDPRISDKFDSRGIISLDRNRFVEQINSLTADDYFSLMPYLEENFERSKRYWSRERQLAEALALELLGT